MGQDLTIDDLKRRARGKVPKLFFDFVDSGSWTESTYRANEADFAQLNFRQRVLVDISDRILATEMAGMAVTMPVAIAPIGLAGMVRADGEILMAQAAAAAGIPFTLSTMSICSIEDIASATGRPFWFQLYIMKDRGFTASLIDRARAANCAALVVTLDLQTRGVRHKDTRNGLSAPPRLTPRHLLQMAVRPAWCAGMLRTSRRSFGNIAGHMKQAADPASVAQWASTQFDQTLTWKDIEWIRERWQGKLILKGILCEEDAIQAVRAGADAIVVSNHGGRQLDGARSTVSVLPRIADAVGAGAEIHLDSGIRSGQDVLKAICLGAKGVYVGRAALYGLGAGGKSGVLRALDIIREEMDLTMAFCGEREISGMSARNLDRPG